MPTPITSINIAFNGTNSFIPTSPITKCISQDQTNPQFLRYYYSTQDCLTMVYYTSSVVIPNSQLYAAGVAINPALTWPPIILGNPTSSIVTHPAAAFFAISASAELPISYSWFSQSFSQSFSGSWSQLVDGAVYTGSSTPALTHSRTVVGDSGSGYVCVATNTVGTTSSSIATLFVI